ncbi:hypothetical protein V8Z74_15155 [Comamonas sp. w2-DMI]|uniref:hypothetical protein n=1 Tax=Comamonas sp. w2-DMI TaxID=3126391 RepID=UPI0032E518DC
MNKFSSTYVAMHDHSGKPLHKARITIKDYVPVLNNTLAYFVFKRKVYADAYDLNVARDGKVPFDFFVKRAKHYGYLYVEVPQGIKAALCFYRDFYLKMLAR